jgi:TPR repeat protein
MAKPSSLPAQSGRSRTPAFIWIAFAWAALGCGTPGPVRTPAELTQACETHEPASCVDLAYVYATGRGAPRDPARAASLYQAACHEGVQVACVDLGVLVEDDDVLAAASLYDDACRAGFAPGCRYAAARLLGRDRPRAFWYLNQACGLGDANACTLATFIRKSTSVYIDKPLLLAKSRR